MVSPRSTSVAQTLDAELDLERAYIERSVQLTSTGPLTRWLVASDDVSHQSLFCAIFDQYAGDENIGREWLDQESSLESFDAVAIAWADADGAAVVTDVRLYVQRWENLIGKFNKGVPGPLELYKGIKVNTNKDRLSRDIYRCFPNLSVDRMFSQMKSIGGQWTSLVIQWLKTLPQVKSELLRYCEISGTGGRTSWLVTLQKVSVTQPQWMALAETLEYEAALCIDGINPNDEPMVHVSGGLTNDRDDYINVYFESNKQRLLTN